MTDGPERMTAGRAGAYDRTRPPELGDASPEWYRTLIEQLPLTVYVDRLDETSSNVYTSPQLEAVLGYSAREWAEDEELFLKIVHPEDRDRVMAEHLRTRETGEPFRMEYRMIARDGRVVWFLDEATVIADETGRSAFHHGVLLDITERKELEEALHKSEADLRRQKQYFESLLEVSPVAVVTLDLEEQVTSWNPAAEKLLGYSEAEALGRSIEELVLRTNELSGEGQDLSQRALEEGFAHLITRRMRKDGGLVDVEVFMVPLSVDGERVGYYVIYHDISDLQRQRKYHESLLEISPAAVITVGLDDNVTSWNPAAEKLFGYTKEEAIGHNIDDLVADSDQVRAEALHVNRRGCEGEYELITRRTRKDGTLVDVQLRVAPVVLEGELVGRYGIYHDISELQRQKQYFQSLLENSPTAIAATDLDGVVRAWNPAAELLFGHTAEEAIGRPIDDLVASSEEVRTEADKVSERVRAGEEVQLVSRRTRKDGSLVDVEVLVAPVQAGGEVQGFYAIYHDISELQRQKQYLQSVLELSPTAIVTTDLEDAVTSWNEAAERLFGYARGKAVGRNIDELVARRDDLRSEAVTVNRDTEEGEVRLVTQRTREDGTLVEVDLRAAPIVVAGERVGAIALYHDISELVRARREAEAANQAKSAFLATMSHEIRTPMNAVIGMSGLLLDTELTSEQREFAEVVRTSSDALLTIIDDILDFSKIEAGKLELERQPLDLRDSLETALDVVASRAADKGLDLAYLLDPAAPRAIVGDPTRLGQILINLLSNAVKFTEAGEVVVSLASTPRADGRSELHFAVRDTGIGIPSARIDSLFDAFSQVDASTTRRYGGTGLGLAISRRLAEMMGGTIWAESEIGKGSTFHFTIVAEEAPALVQRDDEPGLAKLADRRLLVVDDNATNREILVRYAESWGMAAKTTGSPAEALSWIVYGDPFDLALLDLQMPETDGISLAREIRCHRDADALPLVLLTSLGRRREEAEADVEFAAYLTKPIKASQLYEMLVAILAARTTGVEALPAGAARGEAQALRILVAEDNEVNQKLALAVLGKLGYQADVAANGVEALTALGMERYDVVLMDVEMPEMDGLEATRHIREQWPGAEGPRIIAMTANAMQGDREMCLAVGMDEYLAKPIRAEELARALRRRPLQAEVAAAPAAGHDEVLDADTLEQLSASVGDASFVEELIDAFVRDAPGLLRSLREGWQRDDAEAVRRGAHTLKSNARAFGAAMLGRLCEELEDVARAGALDRAAALIERIEEEYSRVESALKAGRREAR